MTGITQSLLPRSQALDEALLRVADSLRGYTELELECCLHCVDPEEVTPLRQPLERITVEAFGRYPCKAITTMGSVADYKHFLPRILELALCNPSSQGIPGFDLGVIGGKLTLGEWQGWPAAEREAIECLWRSAIQAALEAPCDDWTADSLKEVLSGTVAAGLPLPPLLTGAFAHIDSNRCAHLLALTLAFSDDAQNPLCRWLMSPETKEAVDRALSGASSESLAGELAKLRSVLDEVRSGLDWLDSNKP